MMKCFYHDDMDGRCAAFWVRDFAGMEGAEYIAMDYKNPFPMHTIEPDEDVYIVDYSISPECMDELLDITSSVIWIDHHKTAIEQYKNYNQQAIKGIRFDGIAACLLTYTYFVTNQMIRDGRDPWSTERIAQTAPPFAQLIGDRDVWAWKFGDRTRFFHAGMLAECTHPCSKIWEHAWEHVDDIVAQGEIVERYRQQTDKEYVGSFGYFTSFEGHDAFACNKGMASSQLFDNAGVIAPPLLITYVWNKDQWTVSLYSTEVDVSEMAKKYGGGGHKGAAGFQCQELPFNPGDNPFNQIVPL